MSVTYDNTNRQVIPRCLSYSTACSLGLLRLNRAREQIKNSRVKNSTVAEEWTENPSISSAVDLVAEALILKDFQSIEARKAAEYILSKTPSSNLLIMQLANHFLEQPSSVWLEPNQLAEVSTKRQDIARLKSAVRDYPRNPIAWSDLSLYYASLGQNDQAKKAMVVAMSLAGNNRFILRSASRCFMHAGEPDRAVAILNKSGLCAVDPWIASAEIAISESEGLKSKCISKAKDLLEDTNLTPFSISELALSIATIEIKSGSTRRAKKIIRRALTDPTENALAQAEWATSVLKIDINDMIALRNRVPASYEATSVHAYFNKEFKDSLEASKKWGQFHYLSSRPIIHGMFISSTMLNDDAGAIDIFRNALPAQQRTPLAINNYAFALARIGRTEDAAQILSELDMNEVSSIQEKLTIIATSGLILFRGGDIKEGRKLYANSVMGFEQQKNFRSAAIATYYWADEEKRINSPEAASKIKEAKRKIEQHNVFDFEDLAKKL